MRARIIGAGLLALLLASCEATPPAPPLAVAAPPPVAPEAPPARPPTPPAVRSQESTDLALYYRRLERDLLSQGLLRGDGGGADAPFTDTMLARDFLAIALSDEFAPDSVVVRAGDAPSRLRRWEAPVRMSLEFGATVDEAQAARDRDALRAYAARLSRLTGVEVAEGPDANLHVLVLGEDDREAAAPRLRAVMPGIAEPLLRDVVGLPRSTLCVVLADQDAGGAISRAVVVIRAELPDLLRASCVHEELAQAMGLGNDSPQARPSIFNDSDEFGRLTPHDELLLRMLYDPRMRVGMTPEEAAPVAREVARELLAEGA